VKQTKACWYIFSNLDGIRETVQVMKEIKEPPQKSVEKIISLYSHGQFTKAISLAESLARKFSKAPILYEIIGAAYLGLGDADKTIDSYKKLLTLTPYNTDAYNNIGMVFYNKGQFEKAIINYQKAVDLEPNFSDAYYNLGNAFSKIGKIKKAIECYKVSLSIKPKDAEVLNNYGIALKEYGKFDEAVECYTKSIAINPEFVSKRVYASIGAKKLERGNSGDGVKEYKKSIEGESENSIFECLILFLERLKHIKDINIFAKTVSGITDIVLSTIQDRKFYSYAYIFLDSTVFSSENSKEQTDCLFYSWAVPLINHAFDTNELDFALGLEDYFYSVYTKSIETEQHFGKSTSKLMPSAAKAGHRVGQEFIEQPNVIEGKIRKVGFFIHNASMLAHIEVLFEFLGALKKNTTPYFKAFIFCLNGQDQEMSEKFTSINIEIIRLDLDESGGPIKSLLDRLLRLQSLSHSMEIHTLVWLSVVVHMAFVFSMRIVPHQVWWSLKWANFSCPGIDKRLASLSFKSTETYYNQKFLCGRLQFSNFLGSDVKDESVSIRSLYKDQVLLGTLGRSEKIQDPSFLGAVSNLLKCNKNSIFMWTGRMEHPFIKRFFEEAGVEKQVEFIGWVDTQVYAQVFDIHLDTFPFGNGVTLLQSMAAATPVVLHNSMMEGFSDLDQMMRPLFEDGAVDAAYKQAALDIFFDNNLKESLYLSAPDVATYISMAQRLIDDVSYRQRVGLAYSRFIKEMMSDPAETSQIMTKHLLS
jgi:tetratricopeptide (TPR) repeat protein